MDREDGQTGGPAQVEVPAPRRITVQRNLHSCVNHFMGQAWWTMSVMLPVGVMLAQSEGSRPAFEVALVKLNTSNSGHSSSHGSPGQAVFTNCSLKSLIEMAYSVKPLQVSGPDWLNNIRFDLTAKYPAGTKKEDRPLMLRTLLEDRFKLLVHRESKEVPGYGLVVAKGGFRLKPVEPVSNSIETHGGQVTILRAKSTSMAGLADLLARELKEMVIDTTGVNGVYDFEMSWTNDDLKNASGADTDTAPSLFTALQETVGVRLQRQRVPVGMVVVDRVERAPAEN